MALGRWKLYSQFKFRRASGLRTVPMSLKQPSNPRDPGVTPLPAAETAEQALAQHRRLLETLIESTADFIYMKDRDGRYVFVNSSVFFFKQKTAYEIIGKDDRAL